MTPPADEDLVQSAIRLGWSVAEVRGRNRPGAPTGSVVAVPSNDDSRLPLRIERSATELRIQSQTTLAALAKKLRVDAANPVHPSFGAAIDNHAKALAGARAESPPEESRTTAAWTALAETLWDFDAHVQDHLTATSDTQACGYQLGRGLAECYWALDPGSTTGWDSWGFLFGADRCTELTRLAGRLAGYMQSFSASAIAGSLEVWRLLAGDDQWRLQPTVPEDLYAQSRNWYELLVLDQDASRLVAPYGLIQNWRVTLKAAKTFLPQLVVGAGGLLALLLFIFALSARHPSSWREAVTSILSAVGLTAAGLTARLKNQAQALSARIRQDAYTDLLATAITTVPDPPHKRHGPTRQAVIEKAVRTRTLTPSTALA